MPRRRSRVLDWPALVIVSRPEYRQVGEFVSCHVRALARADRDCGVGIFEATMQMMKAGIETGPWHRWSELAKETILAVASRTARAELDRLSR